MLSCGVSTTCTYVHVHIIGYTLIVYVHVHTLYVHIYSHIHRTCKIKLLQDNFSSSFTPQLESTPGEIIYQPDLGGG